MEKKIFVVDSQKLNSIQACMLKFKYAFLDNHEPDKVPEAFEKGGLMHDGLEFYYKARQVKYKWDENHITHADVVSNAIDHMRKKALDMNTDVEDLEDIIRVFQEYCTHTHDDGWNDIISIEKIASKVIYEDVDQVLMYEGKIDLIIGLKMSGLSVATPIDHKTYSRRYPISDMNNQFLGYCWLLDSNYIMINRIGFQTTLKPQEKFLESYYIILKTELMSGSRIQYSYCGKR